MDALFAAVVVLLTATGLFCLYLAGFTHGRRSVLPRACNKLHADALEIFKEPEPICGCGHHKAFHDEKGCAEIVGSQSMPFGWERDTKCPCRGYTGPDQKSLL